MSFLLLLTDAREKTLKAIQTTFRRKVVEAHVFGSTGRGTADAYSDIDVWLTFKDENIAEALEKRFEYYSTISRVIHVCEPPQNSPVNGMHSFVLYKTAAVLLHVDFYICPLSTSFQTKESKNILGRANLPTGELGLNTKKVSVPDSFRIDFFIAFIFIAIKKLARKKPEALDLLFTEYGNLKYRYNIEVEDLVNKNQTFTSLEKVITNVYKVANEKQRRVLGEIRQFTDTVRKNL